MGRAKEAGFPVVWVVWRDAHHHAGRTSATDWPDDFLVDTAGFLVKEDDLFLHIAGEVQPDDSEDEFGAVQHIPKSMVVEQTLMGAARKR